MTGMNLELSLAAFETIYTRLDKTRQTSKTVVIDRVDLTTLLRDHVRLLKRAGELGDRPISPGE